MADISKCEGTDCPIKRQCQRFTATRSLYQSWIKPEFDEDGVCEMFMPAPGGSYLPMSRMRQQVTASQNPDLDMSKPLGTRLSQEEFEEIKRRVSRAHHAGTWAKKGGDYGVG